MFADYVHRRISPTKFVTKLSKSSSLPVQNKANHVVNSDQNRLDPEPGRTPAICEVAEPLIAELTEYTNPAFGQSRFCIFLTKSCSIRLALSAAEGSIKNLCSKPAFLD